MLKTDSKPMKNLKNSKRNSEEEQQSKHGGTQKDLFSFQEMLPKPAGIKKIITKARLLEIQALLNKNDGRNAVEKMRDMREDLESYERRITNKK